jgi:hypothetical protein
MERLLKQVIGIDCAKDDFVVSYGRNYEERHKRLKIVQKALRS